MPPTSYWKEETRMTRVALVTGGTRGIGAAVSRALKAAGYSVAATYAGNSKAAEAFAAETGIHVHQWDIGDFDACAAGVNAVEAQTRANRYPGQQCRHRARRRAPQDDARRNGMRLSAPISTAFSTCAAR